MKEVLQTTRLVLRELTRADADVLFRVIGDAETMRFYLRPFTREETDAWIARNIRRYADDGHGLWAVVLRDSVGASSGLATQGGQGEKALAPLARTGETPVPTQDAGGRLIGDCGLVNQEVEGERLVEVAYHFNRAYWNRGYATEAARACMEYGFHVLKLPKLISLIRPEHLASRRVAEKNGLRIEKQIERVRLPHDVWAITAESWNSQRRRGGTEKHS